MKRAKLAAPLFVHASLSYFALDQLTPKGKRKNADTGYPNDASRQLCKVGSVSVGSWHCTAGGWVSEPGRPTTETFHVLSGSGSVCDSDGKTHSFGPGDTVCLPKGWAGRWDVVEDLHKVWVVHSHAAVEGADEPARAVVTPLTDFAPPELEVKGVRGDADWGTPRSFRCIIGVCQQRWPRVLSSSPLLDLTPPLPTFASFQERRLRRPRRSTRSERLRRAPGRARPAGMRLPRPLYTYASSSLHRK